MEGEKSNIFKNIHIGYKKLLVLNKIMIEVTFLGTSASLPTKSRNHPSIHLKFRGNSMLFDCGEGTQRQLAIAGISPYKIQNIFISHLHADHVLGLGGLIQSLSLMKRDGELHIFGPSGIRRHVNFYVNWDYFEPSYKVIVHQIKKDGVIFENKDYSVTAFSVEHTCPCYAFVFEEKKEPNLDKKKLKKLGLLNNPLCRQLKQGKSIRFRGKVIKPEDVLVKEKHLRKISIVMDANPSKKIVDYVRGSDLLIMEATFSDVIKEKAHDYGHMTARDAARIAKEAEVKQLILTHFSPRYEDVKILKKEAKQIFRNTEVAEDFMKLSV